MAGTRRLRVLVAVSALSLAATVVAAPSASAAVPGTYSFTNQSGVSFPLYTSGLIIPASGATDDATIQLTTTSSGAFRLPFPLVVYGHKYLKVEVSSNGNLQFGGSNDDAYSNNPLPDPQFYTGGANATLFPFWDDLYFVPSDTSHFFREGIYTHTSGATGHKTFVISWQGHSYSSESYFVLAQAVFKQGSQTIKFRYGAPDNQTGFAPSETIGTQFISPTTSNDFLQLAFDPPPPGVVSSGTQFTLTHH
ncbi:MAG: hypothetical protein ACTHNU_00155 [Gaiellales bacterium]